MTTDLIKKFTKTVIIYSGNRAAYNTRQPASGANLLSCCYRLCNFFMLA